MKIIKADGALDAVKLADIDQAVKSSELLVMPTDTVYGIATIPFEPKAVGRLQTAKGRGEDFPPPVLVPRRESLEELLDLPNSGLGAMPRSQYEAAAKLAETFWPGSLTIIAKARPSLGWDLGKTGGTIALRQPNHPVALEILGATGPLAVTSANRHGAPPATNISAATAYFWDKVAIYVDAGESPSGVPSTIVDVTRLDPETRLPKLVRQGGVTFEDIASILG